MNSIKVIIYIFLLTTSHIVYAQSNKEKALNKGNDATSLMQEGKFNESIKLLEEAQNLDPSDINYPYEIAYAYYSLKDFKKANLYLETLLKHKNVNDLVYQMLGNSYDNLGEKEKAIKTYKSGLKLFPNSGKLHLEMGIMCMGDDAYDKAIGYYEKGIELDPSFSSNYYWASKIYCNSTEEVWGMIYGEIFMNLERNSKRTEEISKLLFDTYKSEITFTNDTSMSVSFSKNASINIDNLGNNTKMPYGVFVYEPTLILSLISVRSININTLDKTRSAFIENYFEMGHNKSHPNVLFNYQKKIKDAGHIESYNHWILMKGDEDGFEKWYGTNKEKWTAFVDWFTENKLQIDDNTKFYSSQY